MSFESMKVTELRNVAESFGLELEPKSSKEAVLLSLEEEGISYEMYEAFVGAEKEEEKVIKAEKPKLVKEPTLLVRMERANPSFSVGRYVFTQEHPFVAMSEKDAQYIFDTQNGFRPATPREVQEFYN